MGNAWEDSKGKNRPNIGSTLNDPYLVKHLSDLENSMGETIETGPEMQLCRCGGSKNKPFFDGTYLYNKFKDEKN